MIDCDQIDLPLFATEAEAHAHVGYLINLLQDRDWTTAAELIVLTLTLTGVQWGKRRLRELASLSKG